jgi:hypothetical protein
MNSNTPAKKILILAANPKQTSRLRLDEEVRDIKEGLRLSQQRDKFILQQEWAVRPRDVRRAVLDFRPNIIHFSGHGSGSTGLSFEDETGKEKLVTAQALAGLFGQFAKQVECVVLNACYSEEQALAIAQHIDYVIGMNAAIGDKAALEFAVGFYDALVAYDPRYDTYSRIEFAFNIACNAIQFAGVSGDSIPIMKKKPHLGKVEEQPANLVEESQSSNNTVSANQNQVSQRKQNFSPLRDLAPIEAIISPKESTPTNQDVPQFTPIRVEPNNVGVESYITAKSTSIQSLTDNLSFQQKRDYAQPSASKPQSLFEKIAKAKKKLLAGSAILLISLTGVQIYKQTQQSPLSIGSLPKNKFDQTEISNTDSGNTDTEKQRQEQANAQRQLGVPTQLYPRDGTVFDNYPRETKFGWSAVSGATRYIIEIQFCQNEGCNDTTAHRWAKISVKSVAGTTYTTEFVGAQPGRWRVWAINANGLETPKSDWWEFYYTR